MQKPWIISKSNSPHERNGSECNFVSTGDQAVPLCGSFAAAEQEKKASRQHYQQLN